MDVNLIFADVLKQHKLIRKKDTHKMDALFCPTGVLIREGFHCIYIYSGTSEQGTLWG